MANSPSPPPQNPHTAPAAAQKLNRTCFIENGEIIGPAREIILR